jgi:hypothetical protein
VFGFDGLPRCSKGTEDLRTGTRAARFEDDGARTRRHSEPDLLEVWDSRLCGTAPLGDAGGGLGLSLTTSAPAPPPAAAVPPPAPAQVQRPPCAPLHVTPGGVTRAAGTSVKGCRHCRKECRFTYSLCCSV